MFSELFEKIPNVKPVGERSLNTTKNVINCYHVGTLRKCLVEVMKYQGNNVILSSFLNILIMFQSQVTIMRQSQRVVGRLIAK